jgi:2-methylcitrate dehydratase PrpD
MAAETAIADQYAAAMINSGQDGAHRFQDSYRNVAVGGHHSVNIPANQA